MFCTLQNPMKENGGVDSDDDDDARIFNKSMTNIVAIN